MANKKTPSGKPRPGEQIGQNRILEGVVTFTGSTVIDLKRAIKRKGGITDEIVFDIMGCDFEDAGGAAATQRLATQKNGDGTFTINCSSPATAAWQTGVAVTTNAATLPNAGPVLAVQATTATSAGPKQQTTAAPAAGQVQVAYGATGIPTLTFNGTDAVTVAAVSQMYQAKATVTCTVRWKVLVLN